MKKNIFSVLLTITFICPTIKANHKIVNHKSYQMKTNEEVSEKLQHQAIVDVLCRYAAAVVIEDKYGHDVPIRDLSTPFFRGLINGIDTSRTSEKFRKQFYLHLIEDISFAPDAKLDIPYHKQRLEIMIFSRLLMEQYGINFMEILITAQYLEAKIEYCDLNGKDIPVYDKIHYIESINKAIGKMRIISDFSCPVYKFEQMQLVHNDGNDAVLKAFGQALINFNYNLGNLINILDSINDEESAKKSTMLLKKEFNLLTLNLIRIGYLRDNNCSLSGEFSDILASANNNIPTKINKLEDIKFKLKKNNYYDNKQLKNMVQIYSRLLE